MNYLVQYLSVNPGHASIPVRAFVQMYLNRIVQNDGSCICAPTGSSRLCGLVRYDLTGTYVHLYDPILSITMGSRYPDHCYGDPGGDRTGRMGRRIQLTLRVIYMMYY